MRNIEIGLMEDIPMRFMQLAMAVIMLAAPTEPVYEVIAELGPVKTVHVAGPEIKDTSFYERVIPVLLDRFGRERPVQIEFYDDKEMTPRKKPYTIEHMFHQKAKFNFNPRNGLQRFVWVAPVDPNAEKVRFGQTEVKLRLPEPAAP